MQLEPLGLQHERPFLRLIEDFALHDRPVYDELFAMAKSWDSKRFGKFVADCERERMDWRPKAGKVSVSHFVLMDGEEACGYGRLRFPVEIEGETGNLEFYVPPSQRRKSFGIHTLNRLLFEAVRAGLARAMVVCAANNTAAIKCIEYNRGQRVKSDSDLARFWIRFR